MSGNEKEEICYRIGILRERRGLTQEDLGNAIGVKREIITKWENGERRLKADAIVKLARFFNVSSDYLLGLQQAENYHKDMHEYVRRHHGFFDLLLSAEDEAVSRGDYDVGVFETIRKYICSEETETMLALGDKEEVFIVKDKEEAETERFEWRKSDFIEYRRIDEIKRLVYLKQIERGIEQLREYAISQKNDQH